MHVVALLFDTITYQFWSILLSILFIQYMVLKYVCSVFLISLI